MPQCTGWEALVSGLRAEGIPYLFGLPGDPRHLYDAILAAEPDGGPRAIGVRHETSGAFMAMAYARVSGEIAACFGCPGPGIANLVPGILEAFSGCTPMLVLGVRASRQTNGMGAFQETDHIGMLRPITKWATTVESAERIPWTLRRAIQLATTGQPGPVYVELPADIGLDEANIPPYVRAVRELRPAPDPAAIAAAADLIATARQPLVIVGGGAVLSGAGASIAVLAERVGFAIQTTPAGRGAITEDHPLFAGLVGLYRTTFPREVYESADLLLTIGSRMEEFQSGNFEFFPNGAKLIQIEIDPFEIGRNWRPDVAILADARLALDALASACSERGLTANGEWVERIGSGRQAAMTAAQQDAESALASGEMPLKGMSIVREINRVFGENTIVVKENGGQDLWTYYWPYFQVLTEGGCVPPAEQTAMGYGVVGAIAAKLARPDRQVVCTTGDGAFQMAMHELGTAVQEQLPVTWVVFNDGALGWVQWIQRRDLDGRIVATRFEPALDIVAAARATGCDGERVESAADLRPALEHARRANQNGIPFVVDVPVDQRHHHAEFDAFHGFAPATGSSTA